MDELFPVREINMIAGASGAGKSTWLTQMIDKWLKREPIEGFTSYPRPFIYLSLDRSAEGCQRTFKRVKVDISNWIVIVPEGAERHEPLTHLLGKLLLQYPETRVFFIEAFTSTMDKPNDYKLVSTFLTTLQDFCVKNDVTIVGVGHVAKTKEGENYTDLRQRLLGSVAWGGFIEGIVYIQQKQADNPEDPRREITFLPRNAAPNKKKMEFREGKLVHSDVVPENNYQRLEKCLNGYNEGESMTIAQLTAGSGLPESSLHYEINKFVQKGLLRKVSKGTYVKTRDVFDCGMVGKRG